MKFWLTNVLSNKSYNLFILNISSFDKPKLGFKIRLLHALHRVGSWLKIFGFKFNWTLHFGGIERLWLNLIGPPSVHQYQQENRATKVLGGVLQSKLEIFVVKLKPIQSLHNVIFYKKTIIAWNIFVKVTAHLKPK